MPITKLAAHTSAFGSFEVPDGTFRYGYNGDHASYVKLAVRSGYTKNPVVHLFGGTPWRSPSNYRRFIRVNSKVRSTHTLGLSGGWFVPGNSVAGMYQITNKSDWWSSSAAILDSNIRNESYAKALLAIADNKAQIGIGLVEAKRSLSMLATAAVTLFTAIRHARRGEWKSVERALGLEGSGKVLYGAYPANKWLEYQYGWKPLMLDAHAAYGLLQGSLQTSAFLVYGKGTGRRKLTFTDYPYDSASRLTYRRRYTGEQACTTRLCASINSSSWRNAGQVGLLNPLSIGWEAIPFSFVIDWFMPIGNVFEALTARAGMDFVGGHSTYLTGGFIDIDVWNSERGQDQLGYLQTKIFGMDRLQLTTWPIAGVYFKDSPFNTKKVANALALWRSTLRHRNDIPPTSYGTRRYKGRTRVPKIKPIFS